MSYLVYFAPGACSRVVLTALEQAGIRYQSEPVILANKEQFLPEFQAINPKGKVPCLITPDGVLTEVIAICQYLDKQYPQAGLLPKSPYLHAQALAFLSWCAATLHPCIYRMRMTARIHPDTSTHEAIQHAAREELSQQLNVAEQHLNDGRTWLLGDNWSIADSYFLWVWQRALQSGLSETDWPLLNRWAKLSQAHPAWQKAIAREED